MEPWFWDAKYFGVGPYRIRDFPADPLRRRRQLAFVRERLFDALESECPDEAAGRLWDAWGYANITNGPVAIEYCAQHGVQELFKDGYRPGKGQYRWVGERLQRANREMTA